MKTLGCKNQENPSDRISHTWAPLKDVTNVAIMLLQKNVSGRKPLHTVTKFRNYKPQVFCVYIYRSVVIKSAGNSRIFIGPFNHFLR
jgi:hypothetical protein